MASVLPMSCTWRDLRVPAEGLEGAVLLVTVERKLINVTFERVLRLKRERTDRRVAAYWGRAETKGAARGDRRSKRRAHSSTYYGLRLRWRLRTPRQRFETHPPHFRASINLLQPRTSPLHLTLEHLIWMIRSLSSRLTRFGSCFYANRFTSSIFKENKNS